MRTLKCKKCNSEKMLVIIRTECDKCEHNGIYDDNNEEYVYTIETDEKRTQVDDEGQCEYGTADGEGCHMFMCAGCHEFVAYLPFGME